MAKLKSVWLLPALLFLIPIVGFFLGGGPATGIRNYQYLVSLVLLITLWRKQSLPAPSPELIGLLCGLSLLAFLSDTTSIYYGLRLSGDDFSIFEGMLQQAPLGKWGYEPFTDIYHFGVHQNWILLPLVPIYSLFKHPYTLVFLGTLACWIPGILIVKITDLCGHSKSTAWLAALCWWTAALTTKILHCAFYPESFFALFLFAMIWAQLTNRTALFLLFALLFLSVKEDAAIYLAGFSLFYVFKKDRRALVVLVMCAGVYILNNKIIRPHFLGAEAQTFFPHWKEWGQSPGEILFSVLQHPFKAIEQVWNSSGWRLLYWPLLLIPLFQLDILLASLPFLVLLGISNNTASGYSGYYGIVLWAFALYGLVKSNQVPQKIIATLLILCPLFNASWLGIQQLDWQAWDDVQLAKAQLSREQVYCLHGGLWPYYSYDSGLQIRRFNPPDEENCRKVFSLKANPHPDERSVLENIFSEATKNNCLEWTQGSVVVLKNSEFCRSATRRSL